MAQTLVSRWIFAGINHVNIMLNHLWNFLTFFTLLLILDDRENTFWKEFHLVNTPSIRVEVNWRCAVHQLSQNGVRLQLGFGVQLGFELVWSSIRGVTCCSQPLDRNSGWFRNAHCSDTTTPYWWYCYWPATYDGMGPGLAMRNAIAWGLHSTLLNSEGKWRALS